MNEQKLYLAASGMITSIGYNTAMTVLAARAGINQFKVSAYVNQNRESITMAAVPDTIFDEFEGEIDIGVLHSELMDREIKMAITAVTEVLSKQRLKLPVPLILALPEEVTNVSHCPAKKMMINLAKYTDMIDQQQSRTVQTGRAGGIQALDLAQRYLYDLGHDYILVGGSDSYSSYALLNHLNQKERTTAPGVVNGFVPGEAAAFLLLTRHPQLAAVYEGYVTALNPPGSAEETGHIYSEEPYRGEGLSRAFQKALADYRGQPIENIYSSMNGEHFWAKEFGVATVRNRQYIHEDANIEHPADCYGDIGVATGPVLIACATENMKKQQEPAASLVYSSSDSAWRAAVLMEKLAVDSA